MRFPIIIARPFLPAVVALAAIELFPVSNEQTQFAFHGVSSVRTTLDPRIYRIEYPDGKVSYKNINGYPALPWNKPQSGMSIDSTVIDLRTVDTSLYSSRYEFWQEVNLSGGQVRAIVVGDVNHNGRAEFYGYKKTYTEPETPLLIYERNSTGAFTEVYRYPDSVFISLGMYDIDGDGTEELTARGPFRPLLMYKSPQPNTLPTNLAFQFNPFPAGEDQLEKPTFGDFDHDDLTDVVYHLMNGRATYIAEHDTQNPGLDTVFSFYEPDFYTQGYSVGDFDLNGKTDIVEGSIHGDVYVIENQGDDQYRHVWTGRVETYNAYLHMATHDLDGNGKPEFWVGGDAYYNGLGITRFTCFESNGDNSYVPVHRIDLVGVFSFFAGNCFARDIDGDGKEELFICIDQHVIILKFAGSRNQHAYAIYYLKRNDLADSNSVYYGATMYDITGDGHEELIINLDQVRGQYERRDFTRIYRPIISGVLGDNEQQPAEYKLYQNYPNPFNPRTKINFDVPRSGSVSLKIYDALGKEVTSLVDKVEQAGSYEVIWDARGLPSGVYFIVLRAAQYEKAIKALLIK